MTNPTSHLWNPVRTTPFSTLAEIREYRNGSKIECFLCGKWFQRLNYTHLKRHGITSDEYRAMYGIPWTYSLTSVTSRRAVGDTVTVDQIAALVNSRYVRGGRPRPQVPATQRYWREVIRPQGPPKSAQLYLDLPCQNCGTGVRISALTSVHGVRCKACSAARFEANRLSSKRPSKQPTLPDALQLS